MHKGGRPPLRIAPTAPVRQRCDRRIVAQIPARARHNAALTGGLTGGLRLFAHPPPVRVLDDLAIWRICKKRAAHDPPPIKG